jgi:hypothetical protein
MRLLKCDCEVQEIAWGCILPQHLDGVQTQVRRKTRRDPDAEGSGRAARLGPGLLRAGLSLEISDTMGSGNLG